MFLLTLLRINENKWLPICGLLTKESRGPKMPLHPRHLESLLGTVLSGPPLPRHSSYSASDLCTSVLIPTHHSLCKKDKYKRFMAHRHGCWLQHVAQRIMITAAATSKTHCTWDQTIKELRHCTCKPDFDQIQRVKHQCGYHTSAKPRYEVFHPNMTEHLLGLCAKWGFAGQSRLGSVAGSVVLGRAHVDRALDPDGYW